MDSAEKLLGYELDWGFFWSDWIVPCPLLYSLIAIAPAPARSLPSRTLDYRRSLSGGLNDGRKDGFAL